MVVSNELKEPIRSHHDIDRDSAKHFKRASKVIKMLRSYLSVEVIRLAVLRGTRQTSFC